MLKILGHHAAALTNSMNSVLHSRPLRFGHDIGTINVCLQQGMLNSGPRHKDLLYQAMHLNAAKGFSLTGCHVPCVVYRQVPTTIQTSTRLEDSACPGMLVVHKLLCFLFTGKVCTLGSAMPVWVVAACVIAGLRF